MFLDGSLRHTGVSCVVAKLGKTIKSFKENDDVLEYDAPWPFACTSVLKTSNKNEIIKETSWNWNPSNVWRHVKRRHGCHHWAVFIFFFLCSFWRSHVSVHFWGMAFLWPLLAWFWHRLFHFQCGLMISIFCILLLEAPVKHLDPPMSVWKSWQVYDRFVGGSQPFRSRTLWWWCGIPKGSFLEDGDVVL